MPTSCKSKSSLKAKPERAYCERVLPRKLAVVNIKLIRPVCLLRSVFRGEGESSPLGHAFARLSQFRFILHSKIFGLFFNKLCENKPAE